MKEEHKHKKRKISVILTNYEVACLQRILNEDEAERGVRTSMNQFIRSVLHPFIKLSQEAFMEE